MHVRECACACVHTHTYTHARTRTHAQAHTHILPRAHTHLRTHITHINIKTGSEGSKSGSQDVHVVLGGVNASTSITGAFTYDAPCGAGYTNVVYTISNVTAHGFACVRCAAGKYKSVEGNVQCTACPEAQRMISSQGSTSWLDCLCLPGNPGFLGPAGGPCFGACTHEAVRAAFLHEHSDREFTDNDLKRSCDWELTAFYRAHADKHSCRYLAGSKYLCAARQKK